MILWITAIKQKVFNQVKCISISPQRVIDITGRMSHFHVVDLKLYSSLFRCAQPVENTTDGNMNTAACVNLNSSKSVCKQLQNQDWIFFAKTSHSSSPS